MLVALLINKCHFWDEKAKITTWNGVGCAKKDAGTAWPRWAGRRTASISPSTEGDAVVAEDTHTKVSPERLCWSPHSFSFTPAASGSREMFPRKTGGRDANDWLWAVNPGNPALLCCFSLSISLEIQVIYGSFLHKAGTGVWGAPLEGSWAECKSAGGADLFRADVHNALSQHYQSTSFASRIMWSSWHFSFVLSLPGKLSSKSLSCCNQLPWVTAERSPWERTAHDLHSGQMWRSQISACCHHSWAASAATSTQHCCFQHFKRDTSGRIEWGLICLCSNILDRLRGCFASEICDSCWRNSLLPSLHVQSIFVLLFPAGSSPLSAQHCWAEPAAPQNWRCKVCDSAAKAWLAMKIELLHPAWSTEGSLKGKVWGRRSLPLGISGCYLFINIFFSFFSLVKVQSSICISTL